MKSAFVSEKLKIGLTEQQRDGVVEILIRTLSDLHVLYVKTRNYHWNVVGPEFRDFHKLLEEQYEQLGEAIDLVPQAGDPKDLFGRLADPATAVQR